MAAALLCGAVFGLPLLLLQSGPARAQRVADGGKAATAWSTSRFDNVLLHTNLVRYRGPVDHGGPGHHHDLINGAADHHHGAADHDHGAPGPAGDDDDGGGAGGLG